MKSNVLKRGGIAVGGWVGSLVLFFPIFYMVVKSLQDETTAASPTPKFIFTPPLDNYAEAVSAGATWA